MIPIKLASLNELKEDCYLARDIYSLDGRILLLKRGAKLDAEYRDRLLNQGFQSIFISDEYTSDIAPQEIIPLNLRFQANSIVHEFLNKEDLLQNRVKMADLRAIARDLVVEIRGLSKEVLLDFPEIKTYSDYVYLHSVNIATLGLLVGRDVGLGESELEDFAIGALLHDIGKLKVPQELLSRAGPLTEDEFEKIKEHSRIGFELLYERSHIQPRSYAVALQHHESFDGNGYPAGRRGEEIHKFSRIAKVVDIFDALTSDRPYKKCWSFLSTLVYLTKNIPGKFDPVILKAFLKRVPPLPTGSMVKLSTGEIGTVSQNYYNHITLPSVRIIRDSEGKDISQDSVYEINLSEKKDISIVANAQDSQL